MEIPLELTDLICSKLKPEFIDKICSIENIKETPLFSLNKNRIKKYWENTHTYKLAMDGNFNAVKFNIEKYGKKYDLKAKQDIFIFACQYGHLELVKYLVGYMFQFDNFSLVNYITAQDNEPVISASSNGHLDTVKYLISLGADINAKNNDALTWSCIRGHFETVKYLVSLGVDIKAKNKGLIFASAGGHLDIIKYLESLGADIKAQNDQAIIRASYNGHLHVVKYLVTVGADITAQDDSALGYAKQFKHANIIKYIESGEYKNDYKRNPIRINNRQYKYSKFNL